MNLSIRKTLSRKLLKEFFDYHPAGGFVRRKSSGCGKKGAVVMGSLHHGGYRNMKFKNQTFTMHRLIWAWHFGDTRKDIDHINGTRTDNRIENLRPASRSENSWNQGKHKRNTSGHKGLYFCPKEKSWIGRIMVNGKRKHVLQSKDKNKVVAALRQTRKDFCGDFTRH